MSDKEQEACPRNGQPCSEIIRLRETVVHLEDQQEKTTSKVETLDANVRNVLEFQGGTKVYVQEIKESINSLENRLFIFMSDLVTNLTKKDEKGEDVAAKERAKNTDRWIKFAEFILAGTILLIVAYLFNPTK